MSLSAGIYIPRSILQTRASKPRPSKTYLRWFIGFGVTGLLYSSFAWSVLLVGNARSQVELAFGLPLKGMIRLLEWIHCPDVLALVLAVFPPVTGLLFGILALGACWAWRALGLGFDRAKYVLVGIALFEALLVGYACAHAKISEPGTQGVLALSGRSDSLLATALIILFVGGISLIALSPHWGTEARPASRPTSVS
jgi:hypothetical protein